MDERLVPRLVAAIAQLDESVRRLGAVATCVMQSTQERDCKLASICLRGSADLLTLRGALLTQRATYGGDGNA